MYIFEYVTNTLGPNSLPSQITFDMVESSGEKQVGGTWAVSKVKIELSSSTFKPI